MRLTILLAAIVLLAGCTTAQQAGEAAAEKAKLAAQNEKANDVQCRSYGVAVGSDAYLQCRRVLGLGQPDDGQLQDMEEKKK